MALAAEGGELLVLDQRNRRVQRFRDGKYAGEVALGGDTAQDLAKTPAGGLLVLDPHGERSLKVFGADGALRTELPLRADTLGDPQAEAGLLTGVFADGEGIYVEKEHGRLVRVADASGVQVAPQELPGRPSRDGRLWLAAQLASGLPHAVTVRALDRGTGQQVYAQTLPLAAPVLHIVMLDSDRSGAVYVAVSIGEEEETPPYRIRDERLVVLRLGSGGALRGQLVLAPLVAVEQAARPVTVDDDGVVYVLRPGEADLVIERQRFE